MDFKLCMMMILIRRVIVGVYFLATNQYFLKIDDVFLYMLKSLGPFGYDKKAANF